MIRNGRIDMFKGSMRLAVGQNGSLEESSKGIAGKVKVCCYHLQQFLHNSKGLQTPSLPRNDCSVGKGASCVKQLLDCNIQHFTHDCLGGLHSISYRLMHFSVPLLLSSSQLKTDCA